MKHKILISIIAIMTIIVCFWMACDSSGNSDDGSGNDDNVGVYGGYGKPGVSTKPTDEASGGYTVWDGEEDHPVPPGGWEPTWTVSTSVQIPSETMFTTVMPTLTVILP